MALHSTGALVIELMLIVLWGASLAFAVFTVYSLYGFIKQLLDEIRRKQ